MVRPNHPQRDRPVNIKNNAYVDKLISDLETRKEKLAKANALIEEVMALESKLVTGNVGFSDKCKLIANVVCAYYQVSVPAIIDKNRMPTLVTARQVTYYLCREFTNASCELLGRMFQRDHSAISWAVTQIARRMHTEPKFKALIEHFKQTIEPTEPVKTV